METWKTLIIFHRRFETIQQVSKPTKVGQLKPQLNVYGLEMLRSFLLFIFTMGKTFLIALRIVFSIENSSETLQSHFHATLEGRKSKRQTANTHVVV